MHKVMKAFVYRGCVNRVTGTGCKCVNANLELVDMFCCLGDMLSVDRAAVETRIRIRWNKFRQLISLLTTYTGDWRVETAPR